MKNTAIFFASVVLWTGTLAAEADSRWEARYNENACFAFLSLRDISSALIDIDLSIMSPNVESENPVSEILNVAPRDPAFQIQFLVGIFDEIKISDVELWVDDDVIHPIFDLRSSDQFPIFLIGGPISYVIFDAFRDANIHLTYRADDEVIKLRNLKGDGYSTVRSMFYACEKENAA